jgi:myo-inositol 2-dehydrogenase / D-chiro-inositol 1-dehydrogenase
MKAQDMNKTRYGLVGCGMMGQEHLRNLALLPEAEVTAIFEPDGAMRSRAQALVPQAVFLESLPALLAFPALDALVITSPNHCHADQLAEIARTRPLPILVEKPACTHLDAVRVLREMAKTYPCPIWTAMEYRYMPPIARFLSEAQRAQVTGGGVMLSIREHRYPFLEKVGDWNRFSRNTGGTLVEKCCHFFDLMRLVMQADPVRLFASGGQNHNHLDEVYSEGARYQEEISLVGPAGKLECKVPGPTRFWREEVLGAAPVAQVVVSPRHPPGPRTLEVPVDPALLAAGDHNGSTFYQHQKFLQVLRSGGPVEVSLTDGLKAVVIGLAAEHSAQSGEAVDLTQGPWGL